MRVGVFRRIFRRVHADRLAHQHQLSRTHELNFGAFDDDGTVLLKNDTRIAAARAEGIFVDWDLLGLRWWGFGASEK